jgi:type IV secretion system protein VirB8
MSDTPSIAVQALSTEGKARARQVYDYQKALTRMSRAVHTGMRKMTVLVSVIAVAEAGALYHVIPLVRVVPVFVPVQSDGTLGSVISVDPAVTVAGLKNSPAAISAALWQYVRLRESYNWAEANYAWDVVSAMSTIDVRKQFQDWYIYTNKASPQAVYGFKDAVKVSWAESRADGDRFSVTFWRQLFSDGSPSGQPQQWTCNLAFTTDYSPPIRDRLTYNPAGLAVTSYPGCFPKGATPGGLTSGTTP